MVTVHVLVVDPPRPGLALPGLTGEASSGEGSLGTEAAATLAGAMIQDIAIAAASGGGDLLVNHPTEDQLDGSHRTGLEPAEELAALLEDTPIALDTVRFEPQVGSSFEARVGNTVMHLLQEEGEASVGVLDGQSPTLERTALDSAAMKLRRSEVVVAPAPDGGVAYLGLTDPLDFEGAWRPPAIRSIVDGAVEAGHAVDFLPMHPRADDSKGLATLITVIEARRTAGRRIPEYTASAIDTLGLRVVQRDGRLDIQTNATDRA